MLTWRHEATARGGRPATPMHWGAAGAPTGRRTQHCGARSAGASPARPESWRETAYALSPWLWTPPAARALSITTHLI